MSVAESLFEMKLRTAETFDLSVFFDDLERIESELQLAMLDRIAIETQLVSLQTRLADVEAILSLQAEGKNETERKARKTQLLQEDEAYQELLAKLRELERRKAENDVTLDMLRRKARRIELSISHRIAVLRLLGA